MKIPNNLSVAVSEEERWKVEEWWNSLTQQNQKEIKMLCKEKKECGFIPLETQVIREEKRSIPLKIIGKFENSNGLNPNKEWFEDMYEYLVAHPEAIILVEQFQERTFHICTSHQKARKVLKNGIIPAGFSCPFEHRDCLMRNILQQDLGKSLRLFAVSFSE